MIRSALIALVASTTASTAQPLEPWDLMFGFGEEDAAITPGWDLQGSAGLSLPDGREALAQLLLSKL